MCGDNSAPAAGRPAGAGLELHADLATAPGPMQRLYAVYVLGPRDFDNLMTGLLENPVRQAAGGQQRTQWPQVVADGDVTGIPSIALKIPSTSFCLSFSSLARAVLRAGVIRSSP